MLIRPTLCRHGGRLLLAAALFLAAAGPSRGQVLQGQVLDEATGLPAPLVFLVLRDADGTERAMTASDADGFYRLRVPGPGEYYVGAEVLGEGERRTPLLAVGDRREPYQLNIRVDYVVELEGLEVQVDRLGSLERAASFLTGLPTRALREEPVLYHRIQDHVARGRDLAGILQVENTFGFTMRNLASGAPCFALRRACVPVLVDGLTVPPEVAAEFPLEVAEMVMVVQPNESVMHPAGAIIIYTQRWKSR